VNIEHEAGLSGEIHDKGLLILEGYLRTHYARTFPLSIYAGIAFEQSYAEVDGDSASSSELLALLSAIGELPLRQDIAVTGSVNQMGLIQPVGGINEKIEGFFRTCLATGLTGKQGVIIPKQNIRNLILPYEVLEAIKEKQFFIYPVSTIDEAMQILTGRSVGVRNAKGNWSAGNFNFDIEDKLKRMYVAVTSNRG
jgi:predicted ATP-dependent protease